MPLCSRFMLISGTRVENLEVWFGVENGRAVRILDPSEYSAMLVIVRDASLSVGCDLCCQNSDREESP